MDRRAKAFMRVEVYGLIYGLVDESRLINR